jgi:acyl carrier protein
MEDGAHGNAAHDGVVAAPRTETEEILLEIWSAVLSADRIGIHDDFLDLGGDSLAAMRCINRIRARFDVELPLDAFILEPAHIAGVAAQLDRIRHETSEARG